MSRWYVFFVPDDVNDIKVNAYLSELTESISDTVLISVSVHCQEKADDCSVLS